MGRVAWTCEAVTVDPEAVATERMTVGLKVQHESAQPGVKRHHARDRVPAAWNRTKTLDRLGQVIVDVWRLPAVSDSDRLAAWMEQLASAL